MLKYLIEVLLFLMPFVVGWFSGMFIAYVVKLIINDRMEIKKYGK